MIIIMIIIIMIIIMIMIILKIQFPYTKIVIVSFELFTLNY